MVLTGIIGVVIERVFYRRLTSQGGGIAFAGMGMIIAGFGISMVLQNIAFLIWTARAVPFPVNFGLPLEIGDLMLPRSYLWIVGVTIALMLSLHAFLKYTRLGLAVRAVAYNKDIAYLMGINVPRMISILFGIGCALAAAAGVLIGPINYVEVSMGIGVLIKAFAAAVVGGFGNLPGAVLGGLLVGVVESLGAGYLAGSYKDIYAFILLILVLMVRPSGILGVTVKTKA
jgi:branched-chain amino acid transport system permease protein